MIITIARKPLVGTVVQNVLEHGCGGINIDASRIGTGTVKQATAGVRTIKWGVQEGGCSYEKGTGATFTTEGRWPANTILTPEAVLEMDNQSGFSVSPSTYVRTTTNSNKSAYAKGIDEKVGSSSLNFGDSGGASRFFKQISIEPECKSTL